MLKRAQFPPKLLPNKGRQPSDTPCTDLVPTGVPLLAAEKNPQMSLCVAAQVHNERTVAPVQTHRPALAVAMNAPYALRLCCAQQQSMEARIGMQALRRCEWCNGPNFAAKSAAVRA